MHRSKLGLGTRLRGESLRRLSAKDPKLKDFLIAAAIAAGGVWIVGQIDLANAVNQTKAYCSSNGGTWQSNSSYGQCLKNGRPIGEITTWGWAIDAGVPFVAALLMTRSFGGLLGASVGAIGVTLLAASSIH